MLNLLKMEAGKSGGNLRGKEQSPVQQSAVVMVADQVVQSRGVVAHFRFVGDLELHFVAWVVEVDDVDVKDQDG